MLSWVYGFIYIKAEANIWQNLVEDTLFYVILYAEKSI